MSLNQTTISRRKCGLIDFDSVHTAGGYSLYALQTAGGRVDLIDIRGEKVHEWNMPVRPGRDAVILPNGNLGYNGSHERSVGLYSAWDIWHGGHFMEVTPGGDVVWEYEDMYHHHDAQWLPNGHILYAAAADVPVRKWDKQSDIISDKLLKKPGVAANKKKVSVIKVSDDESPDFQQIADEMDQIFKKLSD